MDFYILRNGEQIGPLTEAGVQALLKSGDTTLDDFAWRDGLPTWQPLSTVLYPKSATQKILPPPPENAPIPTPAPFMSPVAAGSGPATARQKAFLTFLAIPFSGDLTKERAAVVLNDAADDPKHKARVKRWEEERLRLHPELFAEEVQARRENRPQRFLEICQEEGAEFFHNVTKAHAQVLVGYLDVQHPHWDEHADARRYFFAAIAEKFPQLVKSGAKAQLKFPGGSKFATEMERSGVGMRPRKKRSPVVAAFRGIGLGLLVLAALYGAHAFYENHLAEKPEPLADVALSADVPLPTPALALTASTDLSDPTPAPIPPAPIDAARMETAPPPAPPEPTAAAPVVPEAASVAPMTATTPAPIPTIPDAAPPAIPMASATPAPIPTIPDAAPPAIPMTPESTPAPAPQPPGSLLEPPPLPGMPATPAPRTTVKITKPTPVTLRFGSSTLSAGTVVPFVATDGVNVTVRFGPDVITVPIAHTDLAPPP